ncbi:hypothetical protein B0T17DRAFT_614621 [Bombardia bombarda]|uniref:Uncharacterized protein n=1 Tax=Bombardia bombarda TaxID=252184 RepID=A0AA40C8Q6_9PEZI|nr:hypothetical protein B0T17DRAFT_614621 [Bombardia bombarda]
MGGNYPLRQLAVSITTLLSLTWQQQPALALAMPQPQPQVQKGVTSVVAPSPWVTVDPTGNAQTIVPVPTTVNGALTTISAPPDYLLSTSTYTLAPTGRPSVTSTGLAPVAQPTGTTAGGAFLKCAVYQAVSRPFCSPQSGTTLHVGSTYYVTWNPDYFGIPNTTFPASQGFYVWRIESNLLSSLGANAPSSITATVALAEDDPDTPDDDIIPVLGPTVYISNSPAPAPAPAASSDQDDDDDDDSHVNIAAIVIPVIIAAAILALAAFCLISWRRNGVVPIIGKLNSKRSSGYGVRQGRSERVGAAVPVVGAGAGVVSNDKQGIQLTDRESWSPTRPGHTRFGSDAEGQGRTNLFREEIQRQDTLR